MVPRFEEHLMECMDNEAMGMAEFVGIFNCLHIQFDFLLFFYFKIQKGVSSARSDDTKSLKGAILDWIMP